MIRKHQYKEQTGQVAQPRIINVLKAPEIKESNLPNLQRSIEKRPGSGDLIGIPSHYARLA